MDQNSATPDELQQTINNITNPGNGGSEDVVASVTESVAADAEENIKEETPEEPVMPERKAVYGDPDLDRVKTMALSDLRPILESVDLEPEKKFKIYKEIIEITEDKACIEPAYNAAKGIKGDKPRAEALIFIVDAIDDLGIPADN